MHEIREREGGRLLKIAKRNVKTKKLVTKTNAFYD